MSTLCVRSRAYRLRCSARDLKVHCTSTTIDTHTSNAKNTDAGVNPQRQWIRRPFLPLMSMTLVLGMLTAASITVCPVTDFGVDRQLRTLSLLWTRPLLLNALRDHHDMWSHHDRCSPTTTMMTRDERQGATGYGWAGGASTSQPRGTWSLGQLGHH